jgi:hypothetical protein
MEWKERLAELEEEENKVKSLTPFYISNAYYFIYIFLEDILTLLNQKNIYMYYY